MFSRDWDTIERCEEAMSLLYFALAVENIARHDFHFLLLTFEKSFSTRCQVYTAVTLPPPIGAIGYFMESFDFVPLDFLPEHEISHPFPTRRTEQTGEAYRRCLGM